MNFYQLSNELKIDIKILFKKYAELFPEIKILDYTVDLRKNEVEALSGAINKGNKNE